MRDPVAAALARRAKARLRVRSILLGGISLTTVGVLIGASLVRVWRLGTLPLTHGDVDTDLRRIGPVRAALILREGYRVSSTRENALVNMVTSFTVTFAITRMITYTIRVRGGLGPIRDLSAGGRHIHHFIPGAIVSLIAGGIAIGWHPQGPDRWLAIPFGTGIALVADETALLLELEDVYWSEEGVLSVQVAFALMGLLAALGYAIQVRRAGKPGAEQDWQMAARAWEDLQLLRPE
ncbi:MAG: hypothetical protein ACRDL4_16625 [Thermoleophilaceae bacterium]